MARKDAVLYVKKCRSEGFEDELIRSELQKGGWPDQEIDLALVEAHALTPEPPKVETPAVTEPTVSRISGFSKIAIEKIRSDIGSPRASSESASPTVPDMPKKTEEVARDIVFPDVQKFEPLLIEPKTEQVALPPGESTEDAVSVRVNKTEVAAPEEPTPAVPASVQEDFLPKLSKEGSPMPGRAPSFGQENILTNLIKEKQAGIAASAKPIYQNYVKRRSFVGRILGIAGLVLALGASAGGYWYYSTALYPKWLLADSLSAFASSSSYQFDVEAKMTLKDTPKNISRAIEPMVPRLGAALVGAFAAANNNAAEEEAPALAISFGARASGAVDFRDPKNPKQSIAVTLDGLGPFLPEDIGFEARSIGSVYYFQFTDLPSLSFDSTPSVFPFDPGSIERQWVRIDLGAVTTLAADYQERLGALDPSLGAYATEASDLSSVSVTEEEMRVLLRKTFDAIEWSDGVSTEKLATGSAYRYQGIMSSQALQDVMVSALGSAGVPSDDASQKSFEELFKSLSDVETNIWIAKDTEQIAQMSFATSVPFPDPALNGVLEYLVVARFSNMNGEVAILAPEESKDIASILETHFDDLASSIQTSRATTRDTRRIADLSAIASMLDVYYEKNKSYPVSLSVLYPEYLVEIPTDPLTNKAYIYRRPTIRQFQLSATLEDPLHQMLKTDSKPGDGLYDVIHRK